MTNFPARVAAWLARVDPGTHRRIKGLRLVTAYGIAALAGTLQSIGGTAGDPAALGSLAANFALWASVSEARSTRGASSRDLALLVLAAVIGAVMMVGFAPVLARTGWPGPELTLTTGAFLVGYARRFGVLGAGLGSQVYIGQLLAYGAGLTGSDFPIVGLAGLIATVSAIVPRLLSGPAEHPVLASPVLPVINLRRVSPELRMGLQAAAAALAIVVLNDAIALQQSAWAVTASTYVIAGSQAATLERVRRRIVGPAIGVPLGLACLPLTANAPILIWMAAAAAMVIYAMALPERYDIACGAYAFVLVVTLAVTGETSLGVLVSRGWETLLGGVLGLVTATCLLPLRAGTP